MKVLKSVTKNNRRIVTIEINESELASGYELMVICHGVFYKLGGQLEDIVASHVLTEVEPTYWCSIEQRWI